MTHSDLEKAGKYEIVRRIGEGGFGVVYEGRDPFIKRTVAIKTCTSESEDTRRRFVREAEIAGNIVHPNITVVYDFGYEKGVPYLVQEFLSGEDLDEKIARGEAIPLATKIDYLLQAAQGIGFAHEEGVTHRDIKPSNIRILEDGRVKIMDFGIAKTEGGTALTRTGTTLGTPAYLSPEQLRGETVDARSDIYSFGALAFELLTYRRMFSAETISTLFFQILNQAPSKVSSQVADCPAELDELIARCTEKDPAQRVHSFIEVIAGLRRVIDSLATAPFDLPSILPSLSTETTLPHRKLDQPPKPITASKLAPPTSAPPPSASPPSASPPSEPPIPPALPMSSAPSAPDRWSPPRPAVDKRAIPAAPPVLQPLAELAPTIEPPGRSRRGLAIASGAIALVLLAVLLVVAVRRLASPKSGTLVLDAAPWAEVVAIVDAGGNNAVPLQPGGGPSTTPLAVPLAPGRYLVTLAHPPSGQQQTVEVEIAASSTVVQRLELAPVDAADYLRFAGFQ